MAFCAPNPNRIVSFLPRVSIGVFLLVAAAMSPPTAVQAQQPAFEWACLLTTEAASHETVDTQVDRDGNVILAYRVWDPNATSITNSMTWSDNVILKLDSSGNLLWQLAVLPNIQKLALDSAGNTYVAGSLLRGLQDNPPMPATYFADRGINASGDGTAYVARISSAGTLDWVRLDGGTAVANANGLAVAKDGSYYVTGFYTKTAATFGSTTLPAPVTAKARNVFVVKYAADGTSQWARVGQTPSEQTWQGGLALDTSGSPILAWDAYGPLSFGDAGEAITGTQLVRFNLAGDRLWSRGVENGGRGLAVDTVGNIFVVGHPLTLSKYDPNGDLLWRRQAVTASDSFALGSLAVDARGDCIAAGHFMSRYVDDNFIPGTLSFDGNAVSTTALFEMFLVKHTASGDVRWLMQTVGLDPRQGGFPDRISDTRVTALAVDPRGRGIVVGGLSRGTVQFGTITLDGLGWGAGGLGVFATRLVESADVAVELKIARAGSGLKLSWPAASAGFLLESAAMLSPDAWTTVSGTPVVEGEQNVVIVEAMGTARFFRLRKP